MSAAEKIMDSEYEIMKVLWRHSPLTGVEICEELFTTKSWSKSTINTLIRRLVDKGALKAEKRGVFFYEPIVTEEEYNRVHTESLIEKIYKGSAKNLLAALCQTDKITESDIEELKNYFKVKGV